jgi:hypothetical protein
MKTIRAILIGVIAGLTATILGYEVTEFMFWVIVLPIIVIGNVVAHSIIE